MSRSERLGATAEIFDSERRNHHPVPGCCQSFGRKVELPAFALRRWPVWPGSVPGKNPPGSADEATRQLRVAGRSGDCAQHAIHILALAHPRCLQIWQVCERRIMVFGIGCDNCSPTQVHAAKREYGGRSSTTGAESGSWQRKPSGSIQERLPRPRLLEQRCAITHACAGGFGIKTTFNRTKPLRQGRTGGGRRKAGCA